MLSKVVVTTLLIVAITLGQGLEGDTSIYIIIYCLTSDSDPYWAHADYSLYTCGEKTLFKKTP
jgi:hypothetical protein